MTIDDKLFSKYGLKHKFGTEFIPYGTDGTRVYKIKDEYIMFEPVNENQFKIHEAYLQTYQKVTK